MRTLPLLSAAAVALLATACAGATTTAGGQPSLDDEPAFVDRFEGGVEGWDGPLARAAGGGAVLAADGQEPTRALAPWEPPADLAGAMAEAAVNLPATGTAGLVCGLGTPEVDVTMLLDAEGTLTVAQGDTVLAEAALTDVERSDPGEPTLLRLLCATGADATLAVAYAVNATPLAFVEGTPGGVQRLGLLAAGGDVTVQAFGVYPVR